MQKPFKSLIYVSLSFHYLLHLIYIIVEAEDGACKQKRLPDINKKTIRNILYGKNLIGYHDDAGEYQHHCTGILRGLLFIHSFNPLIFKS